MNFNQLYYFESVARLKSFSKAADELYISQPTISNAIKRLEETLEITLLIRDTRSVELTYEGKAFYEATLKILKAIDEANTLVEDLKNDQNDVLNIGIPPIMGANVITLLLTEFKEIYPNMRINIYEIGSIGILKAIDEDIISIGFLVVEDFIKDEYSYDILIDDTVHVVMTTDDELAQNETVSLDGLKRRDIIQYPNASILSRFIETYDKTYDLNLNSVAAPKQFLTILNLVASKEGISFTLGKTNELINNFNNLTLRPLETPIPFHCGLVWKKEHTLSTVETACLNFLKQMAAENRLL